LLAKLEIQVMFAAHSIAEVTRARQIESWHTGSVVLARADGRLLGVVGERDRIVFPRSAVKLIQGLPLVESGAADRFGFSDAELALACGSHNGSRAQVAMTDALLRRLGLEQLDLACGAHAPVGMAARHELIRLGQTPTRLHNNCSGKHVGMLATALHLEEPTIDYELAHHGVQRRIRDAMATVVGVELDSVIPGIDGCSVPNWPLPLRGLAVAFARIVCGQGFATQRSNAFQRLVEACWAAPDAMAGEGRYDTEILRRFNGDVFIKGGAEGVYCGGIRSLGIGFALKADDGAQRASETAIGAIIARFVADAGDLADPVIISNAAGIAVGDIRPGEGLRSVLERIRL
jgi:L-asparaginase II